ncbi:type 1 fimbrial protein [Frateuria edaphi]|uniref:fimbrial protein n=1 Tax=Frateuria edaphi TaxID=2898793 RepID=UPI001E626171|nr:fimbrial protein [Frateuria edaphi]UGB45833.1 type 1 fimbrial protein [Frateuria edaphi]
MPKTLLSAALIATLGVAAFAPNAAHAVDGTINFSGTISGSTCTVQVNGAAGPATVTLPTVSTAALSAAGNTAGQTAFAINLSACSGAATKASTYFENGPNVNASGRLVNTAVSPASNVEVQLVNSDNSVITAGSAAPTSGAGVATISASKTATLNYFARYYATGAAGSGAVASSVQFSVIYQ